MRNFQMVNTLQLSLLSVDRDRSGRNRSTTVYILSRINTVFTIVWGVKGFMGRLCACITYRGIATLRPCVSAGVISRDFIENL